MKQWKDFKGSHSHKYSSLTEIRMIQFEWAIQMHTFAFLPILSLCVFLDSGASLTAKARLITRAPLLSRQAIAEFTFNLDTRLAYWLSWRYVSSVRTPSMISLRTSRVASSLLHNTIHSWTDSKPQTPKSICYTVLIEVACSLGIPGTYTIAHTQSWYHVLKTHFCQ